MLAHEQPGINFVPTKPLHAARNKSIVYKVVMRPLFSSTRLLHSLFHYLHKPIPKTHFNLLNLHLFSSQTQQHSPDLVNEIARVLSDHRNPRHDLEFSLHRFSSQISPNLVEQVLKRCKNLGFSAHRFFLWAKRIPGFVHSVESYQILVDVLGCSKQFALLWDFLMEMREFQYCEIKQEIFWLVFRAYSRANCPNDAIRAFNRMVDFGIRPSVRDLDTLLYCLCKRKHVKHAQQFFDKVKVEITPSAKTYSILINGWGDVGVAIEAQKVFDEMLERGCTIDVLVYNSFLEALCKAGHVDEAYNMFREMRSKGFKPDARTYSAFIRAYCVMNDVHSAIRVLDRMRRYNLVPNVYTYNCIIKKLLKNERVDEAYQLLDEMTERGVNPDAWTYNAILAYHCEHTEVNMATRMISRMVKDNCMPDRHSYNMVLKLFVRIGRFDRATELWESMGDSGFYPSVSTYAVMIHGLCKKRGKLEEACKYFEMMIDEGIPPYSCTIEMLRNLLIGRGLSENVEILAEKMQRSSSCSIRELASAMRGNKVFGRSSEEVVLESQETELDSE